jgi:hypothetical protein
MVSFMGANNSPKHLCSLLVGKFPKLKTVIETALDCDEKLVTMCNDYEACAKAAAYWSESESKQAAERREEYVQLLDDLEAEIIEYIQMRPR